MITKRLKQRNVKQRRNIKTAETQQEVATYKDRREVRSESSLKRYHLQKRSEAKMFTVKYI